MKQNQMNKLSYIFVILVAHEFTLVMDVHCSLPNLT